MFAPVILGHSTEAAYAEAANEQLMVIVQMESKGGVENCEKIAAVEGVDCLFIGRLITQVLMLRLLTHTGPFDLAKQLGVERKGPEHEAAIQRILKAAHSAGKTAAIFCELLLRVERAQVANLQARKVWTPRSVSSKALIWCLSPPISAPYPRGSCRKSQTSKAERLEKGTVTRRLALCQRSLLSGLIVVDACRYTSTLWDTRSYIVYPFP
jgi:hypothetical protein